MTAVTFGVAAPETPRANATQTKSLFERIAGPIVEMRVRQAHREIELHRMGIPKHLLKQAGFDA